MVQMNIAIDPNKQLFKSSKYLFEPHEYLFKVSKYLFTGRTSNKLFICEYMLNITY